MNKALALPMEAPYQETKIPWATFIFLAAIFLIGQQDWYISSRFVSMGGYGITLEDLTRVIEQGNLWRRLAFLSLGLFAAASIVAKGLYRVRIDGALGWLIIFLLSWAFLSLAWSTDPALTFRRLVLLAIFSLGAFAVSRDLSLRHLVLWVFFSSAVYLNIGLVAELSQGTFHPLAGDYRFAGTMHPNIQGMNCVLLILASLLLIAAEKRWRWVIGAVALESLVFLFLTKSRTSLLSAILAPSIFLFLAWPWKRRFAILLVIATLSGLLLLLSDYVFPSFQYAITEGRTDAETLTLTGRIPLWREILPYISERPIQGYGYEGFWDNKHVAEISSEQGWTIPDAHSAYLEIALELGLVGAIMYIFIVIIGIRRAVVAHNLYGNIYMGFIVVALIFFGWDGLLETINVIPSYEMFVTMVALTLIGFSPAN